MSRPSSTGTRRWSWRDARKIDAEAKVGDFVEIEVTPEDFGRIAAQTAKQVVVQRIREAEREHVYEEFGDRVGEVVTCTVARREQRSVYVNLGSWKRCFRRPSRFRPSLTGSTTA